MWICLQTSRDERTSSVPTPEVAGNGSRELLEDTLKGSKPYPNIVLPTGGGFWIDGQDQNEYETASSSGGTCTWNNKIETDDTAKAYRRYYMGRVSVHLSSRTYLLNVCVNYYNIIVKILCCNFVSDLYEYLHNIIIISIFQINLRI